MQGPALSGWLLVLVCAAGGAYCLRRVRRGSGEERRAAAGEAVMGFGMAAMALPATVVAPPEWVLVLYAGVFGLAALAGLLGALRRGGHHLHHLVGSLAMVYMAVAMVAAPGAGAHAGHGAAGTAGVPLLTGALLAYFGVYVLRSGTRLVPVAVPAGAAGAARAGGAGRAAGPELLLVCRLSMALAMLAMLLTL
ncbi:DUF5134 domain-containing protein [Streptomyces showdoensis]|uniref:Membrane protein n=1 Tax=Streptomyces showdoensis TaxID=68268 RepID=A0A2P2GSW0_STREW|nr:DUF5134 domain-containing protein [Streptomyces showdoensis]KKZ74584.1 membrane protein [Streptomyces showdoensis]